MTYLPSFSLSNLYGTLFPVIGSVGSHAAHDPKPMTLAWHVVSYAIDVVGGRRALTKAAADAYLDEVSLAGALQAKRPAGAAFVAMVRDDMGKLQDVKHFAPRKLHWGRRPAPYPSELPSDRGPAFHSPSFGASFPPAANDNQAED